LTFNPLSKVNRFMSLKGKQTQLRAKNNEPLTLHLL